MTSETNAGKFETWAIIEIMGHQTYAGWLTEQTIAGQGFLRIDVPATESDAAFSKLFSPGAIYGITPTTEQIATSMAGRYAQRPLALYDLPQEWRDKIQSRSTLGHVVHSGAHPDRDVGDEFDAEDEDDFGED